MKTRQLARGISVSALGLGCMGLVDFYGASNINEARRVLDTAYSQGVNFFDTADVYANGIGEELLGQFLKTKRQHTILATKCGFIKNNNSITDLQIDASENYIKKACDESLKRLGIDTIDLYLLHRVDPKIPVEESINAMSKLVELGKVRFIGICTVDVKTLQRAHSVHPISVLQDEYSLLHREPESDLLPFCEKHSIGFIPYSPLCRGLLTDTIAATSQFEEGDVRQYLPRFETSNLKKNLMHVNRLRDIALTKNCSVSQLALAWLLAQRDFIVPIPGARTVKELNESLGAIELQLSTNEFQTLNELFPTGCVFGNQYPDLLRNSKKQEYYETN